MSPPEPLPASNRTTASLAPVLGLVAAMAIVVGEVIGSGVFIKPNVIARQVGEQVGLILALWIGCGLVNLCGALTLAELSAMMPHAGGTYVFLREAYGRLWSFLWVWAEFLVIRTGAIASLAAALTLSLEPLLAAMGRPVPAASVDLFERVVSTLAIATLSAINIIGTRWGGMVQVGTTVIKVGFLGFLASLPFLAAGAGPVPFASLWPVAPNLGMLAGIGAALSGIMWAYDGWGQVTVVAEEIRNPQRNVPLALGGGVLLLIVLYTTANLAYHMTLPSADIAAAAIPAVDVTEHLLPGFGGKLLLSMLLVSVFGALNSNILIGPRALFALGRDYRGLGPLRHVDPRTGTPVIAIAILATWAIVLIWAGKAGGLTSDPGKRLFDVLTDYTIFGGSLFYLTAVMAVFVFRRRRPDAPRPYRTRGYPFVPAVFVVAYVFLLGSFFWASPTECAVGLVLIGAGALVYPIVKR